MLGFTWCRDNLEAQELWRLACFSAGISLHRDFTPDKREPSSVLYLCLREPDPNSSGTHIIHSGYISPVFSCINVISCQSQYLQQQSILDDHFRMESFKLQLFLFFSHHLTLHINKIPALD